MHRTVLVHPGCQISNVDGDLVFQTHGRALSGSDDLIDTTFRYTLQAQNFLCELKRVLQPWLKYRDARLNFDLEGVS